MPTGGAGILPLSLGDYFGIPTEAGDFDVNALHFRMYNLIYNQWFRDQNLQESIIVGTGDQGTFGTSVLLRRGKRHDYFTSCLPLGPKKGTIHNHSPRRPRPSYRPRSRRITLMDRWASVRTRNRWTRPYVRLRP